MSTSERQQHTSTPRRVWQEYALVSAVFCVLAVVWTWPLAAHLRTHLPGAHRDSLYFTWLIDWCRQALRSPETSPLYVPEVNWPEGFYIATSPMAPLMVALALPAAAVDQAILGYNLAILIAFCATGIATYAWTKEHTRHRSIAMVAAVIVATLPYRTMRLLSGHYNLVGTFCVPLFLLALERLITSPERRWRAGIGVALAIVGVALCSQYYLYMILVVGVVYGAALFIAWRRTAWRRIPELLAAITIAVPLLWITSQPYAKVRDVQPLPSRYTTRSIEYHERQGIWVGHYVTRPTTHAWWPAPIDEPRRMDATEYEVFLGYLPMTLALAALLTRVDKQERASRRALLIALLWALVLSLGAALCARYEVIRTQDLSWWPMWLAAQKTIHLPNRLLLEHLPFYASLRMSCRYGFIVALFVALLAAIGLDNLTQRLSPWVKRSICGAAIVIVLIEFWPAPLPLTRVRPRDVDIWLGEQPRGGVLEVPLVHSKYGPGVYATLTHRQPFLGAPNLTPQLLRLHYPIRYMEKEGSLEQLLDLGLRYVIVHDDDYPDPQAYHNELTTLGMVKRITRGAYTVLEWPATE